MRSHAKTAFCSLPFLLWACGAEPVAQVSPAPQQPAAAEARSLTLTYFTMPG